MFSFTAQRYLRFKVWEGLEGDEPPIEVKYLIKQVSVEGCRDAVETSQNDVEGQDDVLEGHEGVVLPGRGNVVAWLCCPSTTLVKGEIIMPHLKYDCRLKFRAGKK